ncbi:hypothetical protein NA57DRAFT_42664, partial [Rhizodiscina lignyota]
LCTWIRSSDNIVKDSPDCLTVRLQEGQTICCLGLYRLVVRRGAVEVCKATLHEGSEPQTIYAPTTHALPLIKCLSPRSAEVSFLSIPKAVNRLTLLNRFSPSFRRIWNESLDQDTESVSFARRSFNTVLHSSEDALQRYLRPLEIPPESVPYLDRSVRQVIAVIGPKSSGKSVISKALLNSHLTRLREPFQALFFIDLDHASQELSLHGQITAYLVQKPLLGPAYTHMYAHESKAFEIIRAHPIPLNGPKDNEEHFIACALNLFQACLHSSSNTLSSSSLASLPIIIKFPSLQQGFSSAITMSLLRAVRPTHTISSARGPPKVLDDIALASSSGSLHEAASVQATSGSRTADELRDMHLLSWFHQSRDFGSSTAWSDVLLMSQKPLCVSYASESPDFAAVLCFPGSLPKGKLRSLLDASLISIVLVEDSDYMSSLDICYEGEDGIPYVNHQPGKYTTPLDPGKSRLVGVGLIRGISRETQHIQILSSLALSTLDRETLPPERTLLVHGCFDLPKAILFEQMFYEASFDGEFRPGAQGNEETVQLDDSLPARHIAAPYVEIDNGESRQRREGEAKWKSRRFNMGGSG